jgi:hypothetical protein
MGVFQLIRRSHETREFFGRCEAADFLGACQIYSASVQKLNIEPGQDEKYLAKEEATKLARLIDHATCLEGEICDAGKMWGQYGVPGR